MRTPADLYVPRNQLPLARAVALRNALFDTLRAKLANASISTADKLPCRRWRRFCWAWARILASLWSTPPNWPERCSWPMR